MAGPQLMDFVGSWTIARRIEQASMPDAEFDGTARFTAVDGALYYHETGELKIGHAPPMRSERKYIWRCAAEKIVVFFDDGREFHTFTPTNPTATHWCDPDDYHVRYDFRQWPQWHSIWCVHGPRKDYRMETCYTRAKSITPMHDLAGI